MGTVASLRAALGDRENNTGSGGGGGGTATSGGGNGSDHDASFMERLHLTRNKYSDLGTAESRSVALKSPSLQSFLDETLCLDPNLELGPHDDQVYSFKCGDAKRYPLHFAAMVGDVHKIRKLIRNDKMDPNAICMEYFQCQPVFLASRYGHLAAVITLLQDGADPFLCNETGYNAISEAAKENHVHVMHFLKEVARRLKNYYSARKMALRIGVITCDHCYFRSACRVCSSVDAASAVVMPPEKKVPRRRESLQRESISSGKTSKESSEPDEMSGWMDDEEDVYDFRQGQTLPHPASGGTLTGASSSGAKSKNTSIISDVRHGYDPEDLLMLSRSEKYQAKAPSEKYQATEPSPDREAAVRAAETTGTGSGAGSFVMGLAGAAGAVPLAIAGAATVALGPGHHSPPDRPIHLTIPPRSVSE